EWTTTGGGSGKRCSSARKCVHDTTPRDEVRRESQRRQMRPTKSRNRCNRGPLPVIPVIGKVATELLPQRAMLFGNRVVPVQPTPLSDRLERSPIAARGRLPFDHPAATPRQTPVM